MVCQARRRRAVAAGHLAWSPRNVRGHKNADNADIADAISTAFAGLNLPILIGIYPVRAHRMATGKETWDLH